MSKIYFLVLLLFFYFFSKIAISGNEVHHKLWVYEKVSGLDVFGKRDLNTINKLDAIYSKVTFTFSSKKLTIKNDFLKDNSVCSTDYVKIKKTPISYYFSEKTVALYERLFKYEGLSLPKYIYLLTALLPGDECPPPYSEVLEVNNHLIVLEQNHVLFFKEVGANANNNQTKDGWATYCQEGNPTREYDGVSKYSCFFPNLKLKDAYREFRMIQYDNTLLKKQLPGTNKVDKFNDAMVSYEWQVSNLLNISVIKVNESATFSFNEHSTGTSLDVTEETQY
ncbi:TPA: hypothetical protein RZ058_004789 [Enterobacter cloacae]|nr:hypothetical protein [Enterobacter cloacae]